jgi:hypothetical protein
MSDAARHPHTLGEILLDQRTAGEKVKGAARNAPFWVIAVTAHAAVAFVLGMVVLRGEVGPEPGETVTSELRAATEDLKIVEADEPERIVERSAIPLVEHGELRELEDVFDAPIDQSFDPDAVVDGKRGLYEGTSDVADDFVSLSPGGKGLAGAIGPGSGSGPGAGSARGRPDAGSRVRVRTEQAERLRPEIKAVTSGLKWLERHQSPDGSWDCDGFAANCDHRAGPPCTGRGAGVFDAGVTGLALLAFLGYGFDSHSKGPDGDAVRRGLLFLRSVQDAQGCFGSTADVRHTYAHACATIAMCEAYAATKQVLWKKSAEAAVGYVNACQNPYRGWRYGKRPGDDDSSVTGWMLMALKAAKDAGIAVNDRSMKDGLAYIDSLTDPDTGRTGYVRQGEAPVRPEGMQARWPGAESESLTAVAMCSRIFCDAWENNALMTAGAELLSKKLPVWDEAKGTIDMYYWYYGTLVMHQLGGARWEAWNRSLKPAVVDQQIASAAGCAEGSWDPKDPWGEEGGRVYSTALMTLCLEVYYRYPRVFGTRRQPAAGR